MDLKISDKAFQLAKEWVKNMNGGENLDSEEVDDTELKTEGRPARLGLGAEYVPHSQLTSTINPVEKKLRAKLNVSKAQTKMYKARQAIGKSNLGKGMNEDSDDDDDDEVGRTSVFKKKQTTNTLKAHLLEPVKGNKKRKKS